MAYADLNTLHNPSTGVAPPATWGDQVRDNFEYFNTMLPQGQGVWGSHSSVVINQSVTLSRNIVYSRYHKVGRRVRAQGYATITSSGTANQAIIVSLPFNAVQSSLGIGWFYWADASPVGNWTVMAALTSATTFGGLINATALFLGQTIAGWPNQVVSGDSILWDVSYESTT